MRKNEKTALISLNAELPSLFLEELEQRLETDPLAVGGLLSASFDSEACGSYCKVDCDVYCANDCPSDCGVYCDTKCGEFKN